MHTSETQAAQSVGCIPVSLSTWITTHECMRQKLLFGPLIPSFVLRHAKTITGTAIGWSRAVGSHMGLKPQNFVIRATGPSPLRHAREVGGERQQNLNAANPTPQHMNHLQAQHVKRPTLNPQAVPAEPKLPRHLRQPTSRYLIAGQLHIRAYVAVKNKAKIEAAQTKLLVAVRHRVSYISPHKKGIL